MPIVEINNRKVHVQEFGKGAADTIVMVHGMFSNLSIYYYQIAPLLAIYYHVVLYDLKSHGLSERVHDGYHLEAMSDELYQLIQYLGLNRVHLVGYSFGGLIAMKTAVRFPWLIEKLIVIEAPDPADNKTRDIIDQYSKEFLKNYIDNYARATSLKMGKRQLEKNHRMYEFLFHKTSIREDMRKEERFLDKKEPQFILNQTLLLYGMFSNCLETGHLLQDMISHAVLKCIEGDHDIPVQQPAGIAREILDFL